MWWHIAPCSGRYDAVSSSFYDDDLLDATPSRWLSISAHDSRTNKRKYNRLDASSKTRSACPPFMLASAHDWNLRMFCFFIPREVASLVYLKYRFSKFSNPNSLLLSFWSSNNELGSKVDVVRDLFKRKGSPPASNKTYKNSESGGLDHRNSQFRDLLKYISPAELSRPVQGHLHELDVTVQRLRTVTLRYVTVQWS